MLGCSVSISGAAETVTGSDGADDGLVIRKTYVPGSVTVTTISIVVSVMFCTVPVMTVDSPCVDRSPEVELVPEGANTSSAVSPALKFVPSTSSVWGDALGGNDAGSTALTVAAAA